NHYLFALCCMLSYHHHRTFRLVYFYNFMREKNEIDMKAEKRKISIKIYCHWSINSDNKSTSMNLRPVSALWTLDPIYRYFPNLSIISWNCSRRWSFERRQDLAKECRQSSCRSSKKFLYMEQLLNTTTIQQLLQCAKHDEYKKLVSLLTNSSIEDAVN